MLLAIQDRTDCRQAALSSNHSKLTGYEGSFHQGLFAIGTGLCRTTNHIGAPHGRENGRPQGGKEE
ncbi:hypothetical protein CU103_07870 [Phyllobacterium sophorae]|uniref:Uncharacterized protein n=1 Tax=Phyllobacterium sophorae TaxID=1520277 RepID=A0A2P7BEW2_9HYPH|nr:hypothetical protein CU103_07870 [Phyllobacterium sophorae]